VDGKVVKADEVILDSTPAHVDLPVAPRIRATLNAGEKYEVQLRNKDDKIMAKASYTPDANLYPTEGEVLAALIKVTIYRDKIEADTTGGN
jgi:hypothetical protein